MKVKFKRVFYCNFCKTRRLTFPSMEKHEERCTGNPERQCYWAGSKHQIDTAGLATELGSHESIGKDEITWVRNRVHGCPACMLAVLRQSGLPYKTEWSYQEEVKAWDEAHP